MSGSKPKLSRAENIAAIRERLAKTAPHGQKHEMVCIDAEKAAAGTSEMYFCAVEVPEGGSSEAAGVVYSFKDASSKEWSGKRMTWADFEAALSDASKVTDKNLKDSNLYWQTYAHSSSSKKQRAIMEKEVEGKGDGVFREPSRDENIAAIRAKLTETAAAGAQRAVVQIDAKKGKELYFCALEDGKKVATASKEAAGWEALAISWESFEEILVESVPEKNLKDANLYWLTWQKCQNASKKMKAAMDLLFAEQAQEDLEDPFGPGDADVDALFGGGASSMAAAVMKQMLEDLKGGKIWLQPVSFPNNNKEFSYYAAQPDNPHKVFCLRHGSDKPVVEDMSKELITELSAQGKPPAILVNSDTKSLKDIEDDTARGILQAALGVVPSGNFNDDASRKLLEIADKDISKFFGGYETVDLLMEDVAKAFDDNADPNWYDDYDTVLMKACWRKHTPLVRLLLEKNADVNAKVPYNQATALHTSCRMSGEETTEYVRVLLKAGADAAAINSDKETPLHNLCAERFEEPESAMKAWLLIDAGAPLDTKRYDGQTPLEIAEGASAFGDEKGEAARAALIEVLKDPKAFEAKAKAAIAAAEAEAEARAEREANATKGMKGERIAVKSMGYGVSGGTDAELEFKRADGGDDIEVHVKFVDECLPASFTDGDKPVPWSFLKATLSNFFEEDYNFSSEASMWTTDGEVICIKLFSSIRVKESEWSGDNEWKDVLITLPIHKE